MGAPREVMGGPGGSWGPLRWQLEGVLQWGGGLGVMGSAAPRCPSLTPSVISQVAIKIIDKTQLNPTSLQKVGDTRGGRARGGGQPLGHSEGVWGGSGCPPANACAPSPPPCSSSGKFVS